MALTDVAIKNAKPGAKPVKITDGSGMFLLVTPTGGKLWRLKYRIDGREKLLAIGVYPDVSLSAARKCKVDDLAGHRVHEIIAARGELHRAFCH